MIKEIQPNNYIRCRIEYNCYAKLKILPDLKGLYLENIITDEKYRKRGLATKLMKEMIHEFREDFEYIKLTVYPTDKFSLNNKYLEKWYITFGFKKLGNSNMLFEF